MAEVLVLKKSDAYRNYNLTHFVETIREREGIKINYHGLYRQARKEGLIKYSHRRKNRVHKLRPRFPSTLLLLEKKTNRGKYTKYFNPFSDVKVI